MTFVAIKEQSISSLVDAKVLQFANEFKPTKTTPAPVSKVSVCLLEKQRPKKSGWFGKDNPEGATFEVWELVISVLNASTERGKQHLSV